MTRTQLDRLGNRLKNGDFTNANLIALAKFRNEFIASTNTVTDMLASKIYGFRADISQRPAKSTPSIVAKLNRESCRLSQIQDIGGIRVVVSKVSVQNRVVDILMKAYPEARTVDRRSNPVHGYRAVHVIVCENGHYIEIQVRTGIQNGWAQLSEKLSDLYDQRIKYGGGPRSYLDNLKYLSDYGKNVEDREVALDDYRRAEMNRLHKKKRAGRMTIEDRARLRSYQMLVIAKREAKASMLRYFKEQAKS
jgi:ppGpp synthetase/RelA/SpoT-type nucleotidyltranferase